MDSKRDPIAIVGVGCRVPGAAGPEAFWRLLRDGVDAIREIPKERWDAGAFYDPDPTKPGKMVTKWGAFLDDVAGFDWRAFGVSPREAKATDPQQRLLLEVAWEAFEDAGLPLAAVAGTRCAVVAGLSIHDYDKIHGRNVAGIDGYTEPGNLAAIAANRISYFFDLKGPSMAVDAACAASTTAIHLACTTIWSGDADLALAGGVNLILLPDAAISQTKAGLLSPTGRCHTLDAKADGLVGGEGAGVVVLKPLSRVQPGEHVYACILGTAVNHGGRTEWMMAPSPSAQEAVIRAAYERAGVHPGDVDYVELHGSGTKGDPVEARALAAVVGKDRGADRPPCYVGSVKTNLGNLSAAAGVIGVIKTALALEHGVIPPSLNFSTPNPAIDLEALRLAVSTKASPWPIAEGRRRLAGCTGVGLGGSNAHIVLAGAQAEDLPQVAPLPELAAFVLPISARSEAAVRAVAAACARQLHEEKASLYDVCHTASVRRTHHDWRVAVAGRTKEELAARLEAVGRGEHHPSVSSGRQARGRQPRIAFVYAGASDHAQWLGAGRQLRAHVPAFRQALEACDAVVRKEVGWSVTDVLTSVEAGARLEETEVAPLAIFSVEVALTAMWQAWGVVPDAVVGHGTGELAAAHAAGALSLEDAVRILCRRHTSANVHPRDGQIAFWSSGTGEALPGSALDASHWARASRKPAGFRRAIESLSREHDVFVELSPHSVLFESIEEMTSTARARTTLVAALRRTENELEETLAAAGRLYASGARIDWSGVYPQPGRCVRLPLYPWQRQRMWVDPPKATEAAATSPLDLILEDPARRLQRLEAYLVERVTAALCAPRESVDRTTPVKELGFDSVLATALRVTIKNDLGVTVSLVDLISSPTIGELAIRMLDGLAPRSAWLPSSSVPAFASAPSERETPFPTSDLQQAYWFGQSKSFELGNINAHFYVEYEFPTFDVERFERALQRVIDRHDMLRAVVLPDGQLQVVEGPTVAAIQVEDLRTLADPVSDARLATVRREMMDQGPPTDRWPLFELRAHQLRDRVRLNISVSLIVGDGEGISIFLRELAKLYADPSTALEPLTLTARDYRLAIDRTRAGEALRLARENWWPRLPSLPGPPELPLARAPSSIEQVSFSHREGILPRHQWLRFKARAAEANLTPTAACAAAYAEVIGAWSKTRHFALNALYFNRPPLHPEAGKIIGNFSTTLFIEVDARADASFEEHARKLQHQLASAIDHSAVTGVDVVRELNRIRRTVSPAMPVVFVSLLGAHHEGDPFPAEWAKHWTYDAIQTPQVWIDHRVFERDGELVFGWDSVDALFPDGVIDEMFSAYARLLALLADDPRAWKQRIPGQAPTPQLARREALVLRSPLDPRTLDALVVEACHARPDAPAVLWSGGQLTYRELLSRASTIARRLRSMGVRPNTLVALVMTKGWEQIVGALAILLSGAAYVPIEASLPEERVHHLLKSAEATIALTQCRVEERVSWPDTVRRIRVDAADVADAARAEVPLEPSRDGDALAYVIFTSGSTGQPKGVMIAHSGAVNTVLDVNETWGVGPSDRVLALSEMNFDLSVYDVFGVLAAGGAVVFPDAASSRDPAHWGALIERHGVTVWNSVPAMMEMFVEHCEGRREGHPCGLRLVMLSGDWIPVPLPDRIKKLREDIRVVSMGGATEASIWSVFYPIEAVDPSWRSIPYGRPMKNQTLHVLDERLDPSPTWVTGDLYIGGIGVALGYWRDEEKTRARFITHPRTGERLYATGDLARYMADGEIEFLGRADFQVKIQGFRVELGEIETVLATHPAVQSVVVGAEGTLSNKRLQAYVVIKGSDTSPNDLRGFLATKLPAYMVPHSFVFIDGMPLTANGKVDRAQLAQSAQSAPARRKTIEPPRTDLERRLLALWEQVLDRRPIGISDDFFEIGGQSLLAVRLMARVAAELGRELPLAVLFQARTVAEMARTLEETAARDVSPLVSITRAAGTPLAFVHPSGGNVLCYAPLARVLGAHQPFLGLQSRPDGSHRVEDLADRYLAALRAEQPTGPYLLGGWSFGGLVAFEMAQRLIASGEKVALLAMIDTWSPGQAPRLNKVGLLAAFLRDIGAPRDLGAEFVERALRRAPEASDPLETVLAAARTANIVVPSLGHGEMRTHFETYREHMRAGYEYEPRRLAHRALLVRATQSLYDVKADGDLGWSALTESVETHVLEGDHFSILTPPRVTALGGILERAIGSALGQERGPASEERYEEKARRTGS